MQDLTDPSANALLAQIDQVLHDETGEDFDWDDLELEKQIEASRKKRVAALDGARVGIHGFCGWDKCNLWDSRAEKVLSCHFEGAHAFLRCMTSLL